MYILYFNNTINQYINRICLSPTTYTYQNQALQEITRWVSDLQQNFRLQEKHYGNYLTTALTT